MSVPLVIDSPDDYTTDLSWTKNVVGVQEATNITTFIRLSCVQKVSLRMDSNRT